MDATSTVPYRIISMIKRFIDLLSDVNFVHIWSEMMIAMGGFNTYLQGGDEGTGIAGLAEALERELKGIRCEISVIADKIRSKFHLTL